jgi:predicted nucleic acid-binding protein
MIVVADTSPVNYLVLIDEIELLPFLFGHVLLPQAVLQELQHSRTPEKVRQWIAAAPAWLEVRSAMSAPGAALMNLDSGEREAILLAVESGAGVVLMDDTDGRRIAESFHLEVRGTLGILERAARLGRLEFRAALTKLEQTRFRLTPAVRQEFLRRNS